MQAAVTSTAPVGARSCRLATYPIAPTHVVYSAVERLRVRVRVRWGVRVGEYFRVGSASRRRRVDTCVRTSLRHVKEKQHDH
jgi:hypothetical protein